MRHPLRDDFTSELRYRVQRMLAMASGAALISKGAHLPG